MNMQPVENKTAKLNGQIVKIYNHNNSVTSETQRKLQNARR